MGKTRRYYTDKFDDEGRFTGNKKVKGMKILPTIIDEDESSDSFADEMTMTDQIFITHTKNTI